MRYQVIYSTSRGGYKQFTAEDDAAAWEHAHACSYGARIVQLVQIRTGNPDHVRILEEPS